MKKILCLTGLVALTVQLFAQGTAFTYQGRLGDGANAANGVYDLRFKLYADALGTTQLGASFVTNGLPVSNGLFTIVLNFGANFPGADRWLEVAVKTNLAGSYTVLSPLQSITATPYAMTAANLNGTLPSAQLSGTYGNAVTFSNAANSFSGSGAGLNNVNAATLSGLASSNFWKLGGNTDTTAGTHFIGTTDNQALELKVNGSRALRIESGPTIGPNIVGGDSSNTVGPGTEGAVIAGGRANNIGTNAYQSFIGGGGGNKTLDNSYYATIVCGRLNTIGIHRLWFHWWRRG